MNKSYALSNDDIDRIFKKFGFEKPKILMYDDLANVDNFNQILDNGNDFFILHVPNNYKMNQGHWVCVLSQTKMNEPRKYVFFDPYGKKVDSSIYFAPKKVRKVIFNEAYLSYLFNVAKKNGDDVSFNCYPFQKNIPGVNTCGKWVCARILYFLRTGDISTNLFLKYIKDEHKNRFEEYDLDGMIALLMNPNNPVLYDL